MWISPVGPSAPSHLCVPEVFHLLLARLQQMIIKTNQWRAEKHHAYDSCKKCNSSALHVPVQALMLLGTETASDPEG